MTLTEQQLAEVLRLNGMWLRGEAGGRRADLSGADLSGAVLTGADLRGAILRGADLRGADLRDADLTEAYLTEADLTGADVTGANLTGAELRGADLRDADLTEADLTEADLTGADVTGANLSGVKGYIVGPQRSDGYRFDLRIIDGTWRVVAGCQTHRNLTIAEYRAHTAVYRDAEKTAETLDILDYLEKRAARMDAKEAAK